MLLLLLLPKIENTYSFYNVMEMLCLQTTTTITTTKIPQTLELDLKFK